MLNVATRLVAPLINHGYFGMPIERLNPRFIVQSEAVILSPKELTAVRTQDWPAPINEFALHRDVIVTALDTLLTDI